MVNKVNINNKKIQDILSYCQTLDFVEGQESYAKGWPGDDYESMVEYATCEKTLLDRIHDNIQIKKINFNKLVENTEAGRYFISELKPMLSFDACYTSAYIPKGFIRWHDDTDVPGYVLMFSYAKTTNGTFKYRDPATGSIYEMTDEVGWTCKSMYFDTDPNKALWHCASSKDFRATFVCVFEKKDKYQSAIELIMRE